MNDSELIDEVTDIIIESELKRTPSHQRLVELFNSHFTSDDARLIWWNAHLIPTVVGEVGRMDWYIDDLIVVKNALLPNAKISVQLV